MNLYSLIEKRVSMPEPQGVKGVISQYQLRAFLADRGWRFSGEGNFGSVFINPKTDQAFKFFNDPAYLKFLSFTKRMDNPHFPNTGKPFRLKLPGNSTSSPYGVMIEKLEDNTMEIAPYVSYFEYREWEKDRTTSPAFIAIEKKFPRFKQACRGIERLIGDVNRRNPQMGMRNDVEYDRNMMMRGDCPVFTDPVWQYDQI